MSRTYRRKRGNPITKWSEGFGIHQYQRRWWYNHETHEYHYREQPSLEELQQDYLKELEEDKVYERKFHTDYYGYSWNLHHFRKEYTRAMGLRSSIRQECRHVMTSGEYDTFDDSKQVRAWKSVAWIVD